jgi:hypothetical protein
MLDLFNEIGALLPTKGPTLAHPDDAYREGYAAAIDDVLKKVDQAPDASTAAIAFALETDEGMTFLRCWNEGDFDAIRREWPEAPDDVFDGADPLFKRASSQLPAG